MKHVYPPRHPAWLDAKPGAAAANPRDASPAPGSGESARDEAGAAPPQRQETGRKACGDATGGKADTDRGPVMDRVYNEKVAPGRSPERPRR